jgi:putative spermidine/putrescine transport system ATP-binding protein
MKFIQLPAFEKSFGAAKVVQGFDLDIARGEFVSLLGPSGCGKTTVLRMIAGFEAPEIGDIVIGAKSVLRRRANLRNFDMMFQSDALFPNLTSSAWTGPVSGSA